MTLMLPLVSILIPAFNAEKWIGSCIESAMAQTWDRKEIIVVDDASTDSTLEVARSYASSDVHVITQQVNCGASSARNRALSMAQGDYIQWLDADDRLAPDKISLQLDGAEPGISSRILLSGAWGEFYERPEKTRFRVNSLWENLEPKEWLYRKIDENLWMAIESWLVSRRLIEMAGPWNENLSLDDDGEYFCRVISCCTGTRFIPNARCFCRSATYGLSHDLTLNNRKLDSFSISILFHIQSLLSLENSARTRDACLRFLNHYAIYFYPERPDLIEKMQAIATELGGQIDRPKLRSKYQWLQRIFGWRIAKKAQYTFPALRSIARKNLERFIDSQKMT